MSERMNVYTKEEIENMVNINEDIREILDVPNKNNLYKDLGLNITYLNLKNFISGRDPELKKKSIDYLSEKINVLPLMLFIDIESADEEDLLAIKKIQLKFLEKLSKYTEKFNDDKKRIKTRPVTDEDIESIENILKQASVDIDLSDLNIQI